MNIFTALLITGLLILFLNAKLQCPSDIKRVEYRYLPRNLHYQMQDSLNSTNEIMKTMEDEDGDLWIKVNNINTVNN